MSQPGDDRHGWIHVKLRLPESRKNVMVVVEVKTEAGVEKYRTRAFFLRRYEWVVDADYPDTETALDAQGYRQHYVRGGWYENALWGGQHRLPLNARVTHWQPFPDFPGKVYGLDYGPNSG